MLNNPTKPKNNCMSTRDSSRTRTLRNVTYVAYTKADSRARKSPTIGARPNALLTGLPDGTTPCTSAESDNDTKTTPPKLYNQSICDSREAVRRIHLVHTASILMRVNVSTRNSRPTASVKKPVRISTEHQHSVRRDVACVTYRSCWTEWSHWQRWYNAARPPTSNWQ